MSDIENKECPQINECERRLNNIDVALRDIGIRLSDVEKKTIVYNEQIKMIFNVLEDIKLSLKELQKAVSSLEKRPADLSQKIFLGVLTSMLTALLMLGLRFI